MTTLLKEAKRTVKNWWLFVLLGVLLIIGSIYVMFTPVESYITLSIFLSILVFVNGISDVFFSISNHKILKGWGWYLAGGILEILLGLVLMNHPDITMNVLPLILGFWLMFGAVSTISGAFDLKSYYVKGWGWMLVLGILLLIFGFMVLAKPMIGLGSIVTITSIAIFSYGVSYVLFGLKMKDVKDFSGDIKEAVINNLDDLKNQVLASIKDANEGEAAKKEVGEKFDSFKDSIK